MILREDPEECRRSIMVRIIVMVPKWIHKVHLARIGLLTWVVPVVDLKILIMTKRVDMQSLSFYNKI